MNIIRSILRNHFFRMQEKKNYFVVMLAITGVCVLLAVAMTRNTGLTAGVAWVTDKTDAKPVVPAGIQVTLLQDAPPMSALVMNRYDAVVREGAQGLEVTSLHGGEFNAQLKALLEGKGLPAGHSGTRGRGATILGFMTMFILMQASTYMMMYSEDKETKIFRRIVNTPASVPVYLTAQVLFNMVVVVVPPWCVLAVVRVTGTDIGFSLGQAGALLLLLAFLAASFALMMASLFRTADNCVMAGSAIVMITSILAGSFRTFSSLGGGLDALTNILPQKHYLTLISEIEQGAVLAGAWAHLVWILGCALLMMAAGWLVTGRRIRTGMY